MSQATSHRIIKKRLTGNQRNRLREVQAQKLGMSSTELLQQRHSEMKQWQDECEKFKDSRCPNCGAVGHNFKWCPFSSSIYLRQRERFRGQYGSWDSKPHIVLTKDEMRQWRKHFGLLSMPLPATISKVTEASAAKVSLGFFVFQTKGKEES